MTCVLAAGAASAQTNLQLWGDVSLNRIPNARWSYSLDLEPQALVAETGDTASWFSVGATPAAASLSCQGKPPRTAIGSGWPARSALSLPVPS